MGQIHEKSIIIDSGHHYTGPGSHTGPGYTGPGSIYWVLALTVWPCLTTLGTPLLHHAHGAASAAAHADGARDMAIGLNMEPFTRRSPAWDPKVNLY